LLKKKKKRKLLRKLEPKKRKLSRKLEPKKQFDTIKKSKPVSSLCLKVKMLLSRMMSPEMYKKIFAYESHSHSLLFTSRSACSTPSR